MPFIVGMFRMFASLMIRMPASLMIRILYLFPKNEYYNIENLGADILLGSVTRPIILRDEDKLGVF